MGWRRREGGCWEALATSDRRRPATSITVALGDHSSSAEVKWWHLLAHAVAFCAVAAIGGILIYPSYPRFRAQTDTAGEAFGAFLTCCVIAGGIGPLFTLCLFGLFRLCARARRSR